MRILKSLFYSIRTKSKVIIYSKADLCSKSSNIKIDNYLQVGKKWHRSEKNYTSFTINKNAKVEIGKMTLFSGCKVTIKKDATFIFKGGYLNSNVQINCKNKISIGEGCVIANNVVIRDNNSHSINGSTDDKKVLIGNHVWIGTNAIILPGAKIGDGCAVAAGAIVNKEFPNNTLIGGVPAKVIKENITWSNY